MPVSSPTAEDYLAKARAFVSEENWTDAESCLNNADILSPKNRDLIFYRARLKAFQKDHKSALALVDAWPAEDRESQEIRGDLAWYRGDPDESARWYRLAASKEAPASTWKQWLKAVKASDPKAYPIALDEALQVHPKDQELLDLKDSSQISAEPNAGSKKTRGKTRGKKTRKIDTDRAKYRAGLTGTYVRETQNQNLMASWLDAAIIARRKSFSLGVAAITRDYGSSKYTDNPVRADFGIGFLADQPSFFQSQESTLSLGISPDAVFTPKHFVSYRHDVFFSDDFSVSAELGAKWYPELYVRTANLSVLWIKHRFRNLVRLFNTHAKTNDFAGYLGTSYEGYSLVPELYLVGGRDAASRPYLLTTDNAAFFALGSSLSYRFHTNWQLRGVFEQRWEKGFHQQTFSGVLQWFDR